MSAGGTCRACGQAVEEFLDFGRQPLSDAFRRPGETEPEFFFRLAVGVCGGCTMVQLMEEVPRERMFHQDYPYHSSGSSVMGKHFAQTARGLLESELTGPDPFIVEIGCNDGVMLRTIHEAGVRHLGVDPSGGVAQLARDRGVRVRTDFFEAATAASIRAADGPADVVYAANTICHIPYLESIFEGLGTLLTPGGAFVFEDPYLGDIIARTSFDQIYDEHFFFFTARSVRALARRFGFDLVDVERLPVHGGEVRYTVARQGARAPRASVAELLAAEDAAGLAQRSTLDGFAEAVRRNRADLVALLTRLRDEGRRVVGYGATAKSATVTNYCGIGTDLVEFVCDSTPAKQGRLTPGAHLPVRPSAAFADPYPDYALLFAWNHADEIMAKEQGFREAGGRWIRYVPTVTTEWRDMEQSATTRVDGVTEADLIAERDRLIQEPMTRQTLVALFDTAYRSTAPRAESAPWEIDAPQPEIVALAAAGLIRGAVLDIGCGTGENTIHLARQGLDVLGVDASEFAIAQARRKAEAAGVAARFAVADALDLREEAAYDTVVDSAVLHIFEDAERAEYVAGLHRVTRPGGLVHVLVLSDEGPDFGAPVIGEAALRAAFAGDGWRIEEVRRAAYRVTVDADGGQDELPAWLARIRRH